MTTTSVMDVMSVSNKKNKRYIITAQQQFDASKPRYNAHQTGTGAHGKNKYSRKRKHKGDDLAQD